MRKLLLSLIVAAGLYASAGEAHASSLMRTPGSFGIGFGQGWAGGFSGKYVMADMMAVQGSLGVHGHGWGASGVVAFGADILFLMPLLHSDEAFEMGWNVGLGPGISLWTSGLGLGAQAVVGFELNMKVIPIDLVFEYRPGFRMLPDFRFAIFNFGGHIRLYF